MLSHAQTGLTDLADRLWRIARGEQPRSIFPMRIVDDPVTARAILSQPTVFPKNYDFLSTFAQGRFTDNGAPWTVRTAVTQPHYSRNVYLKETANAEDIYDRVFARLAADTSGDAISAAVVAAAVTVVSTVFGLAEDIPWDKAWTDKVRDALVERQWIGFAGTTPAQLALVDRQLHQLRQNCEHQWAGRPDVIALLAQFTARAGAIAGFNAAQELIQNVIASSETTAAIVLWAVHVLAKNPAAQEDLRCGQLTPELFLQELLRLYPPVPFVTRYAAETVVAGNEHFIAGEPFALSILGLHYAQQWDDPLDFRPARFANSSSVLKNYYLPFLTGPRACGGRRLAELELIAAIKVLVAQYHIISTDARPDGFEYGLSFRPVIKAVALKARETTMMNSTQVDYVMGEKVI